MKSQVTIEKVNYFGESTGSNDYNAKALYRKNGKLYLVHVYVDFFNNHVFVSRNQPKECKVLSGVEYALNEFAVNTNWIF